MFEEEEPPLPPEDQIIAFRTGDEEFPLPLELGHILQEAGIGWDDYMAWDDEVPVGPDGRWVSVTYLAFNNLTHAVWGKMRFADHIVSKDEMDQGSAALHAARNVQMQLFGSPVTITNLGTFPTSGSVGYGQTTTHTIQTNVAPYQPMPQLTIIVK